MTSTLVHKLQGVRDLKKILETTVQELGENYSCDICQIVLSSPLDENVTAICEHRLTTERIPEGQLTYIPLVLQGRATGQLGLSRSQSLNAEEIENIRATLAELGDIVRHAQINDVVQRETFRNTFMVEIGNVMNYSLGIGDALFMVVNILGKVLNASRCIFICTDDTQRGWRCYEYWQQNKVPSCQEYHWPTTHSVLVAQTLLSEVPFVVYEGQENSFVTPVQEELQFLGVKSALGVPLNVEGSTHGCVILQQCDYRRAWSRGEIDMVQNVADEVAKALIKLPAEKLVREPIMQLHQQIISTGDAKPADIQSVRKALKGALGLQAIPTAQKTSAPPPVATKTAPPPAVAKSPAPQEAAKAPAPPEATKASAPPEAAKAPALPEAAKAPVLPEAVKTPAPPEAAKAPAVPEVAKAPAAPPEAAKAPESPKTEKTPAKGSKSLGSILGGAKKGAAASVGFDMTVEKPIETPVIKPSEQSTQKLQKVFEEAAKNIPVDQVKQLDNIPAPDVQAAPTPSAEPGQWGNLDSIPTPNAGPANTGLGTAILNNKPKGPQPTSSSLMASFHRDKSKFVEPEQAKAEFVEGPPIQIDEAEAEAKIKQILSTSDTNSDYIFATPGVDTRVLGRIDGWVTEIEAKDKYASGHERSVAEYAIAVAKQIGLAQADIDMVRLAALVHDVGKLGAAPELLQKADEDLTDSELLLVMKHPMDGAELLESFPDLKHLAPIVRAYREEWDGNGYPDGLKGEDIPLLARIISVADSYYTMTCALKSRPAMMSSTDAQQVLTKGAGTQWDPRVVEALILVIMQKKVPGIS